MSNYIRSTFYALSLLVLAIGCSDKNEDEPTPSINESVSDTVKVNKFVLDCTQTFYLWSDMISWSTYEKNYSTFKDPQNFFDAVRYKDDKWSILTNDIQSLQGEFEGVNTSFGWVPLRVGFGDGKTYFYIVLFVYPGTPADIAGIKRGDYIVYINNKDITSSNYLDVYYASSITVNKGRLEGNTIYTDPTPINLTAVNMYHDPILKDTVIIKGDKRIAYLCYTDFYDISEPDLVNLFKSFKNKNVTDVILDLRYNGGGYVRTSVLLTSLLAPPNVIQAGSVYQYQIYNNLLSEYYRNNGDDMAEYFTDTLLYANVNPQSVYFLTSEFTASASEASIIALKPYMTVKTVGETTAGKFVGGGLLSPPDIYETSEAPFYNSIKNWGMYLMFFRYTNKDRTYFIDGLTPDYSVITDTQNQTAENYFDLQPFGSESDPLLNEAIYRLTGVRPTVTRAANLSRPIGMNVIPDLSPAKPLDGKFIATPSSRPLSW